MCISLLSEHCASPSVLTTVSVIFSYEITVYLDTSEIGFLCVVDVSLILCTRETVYVVTAFSSHAC